MREQSSVVQAEKMVDVPVGKQHGMRNRNLLANELQPQLGRRVNQDRAAGNVNRDSCSHSLITRIHRSTDVAVATDHRNAGARPRS